MEESADKEQRKLTLTDKFAREKERKDISDWKKIYLYREGTFLRAFNASAWLLATYVYNDEFLGAFVKPYRIYISSQSLRRVYYRMDMELPYMSDEERFASINSTLGVMSHYDSYNIRKELTERYHPLYYGFAHCNEDRTKLIMN